MDDERERHAKGLWQILVRHAKKHEEFKMLIIINSTRKTLEDNQKTFDVERREDQRELSFQVDAFLCFRRLNCIEVCNRLLHSTAVFRVFITLFSDFVTFFLPLCFSYTFLCDDDSWVECSSTLTRIQRRVLRFVFPSWLAKWKWRRKSEKISMKIWSEKYKISSEKNKTNDSLDSPLV